MDVPTIITALLLQSYLLPGIGGLLALTTGLLAIWNRKAIASFLHSVFSQGGLFYAGIGIFMLASVIEAGPVVTRIATHEALWGYGGYLLVFAFDVVAAVSLRARLNARRVFDQRGMRVQMWGICIAAGVSFAANLAGAIQSFQAGDFSHLGLLAWTLPLVGAAFPAMIVILSLAADHMIDTTAITTKINVDEFRALEQKRIDILSVRLDTEMQLLAKEAEIARVRLRRDRAQGGLTAKREWFWMQWVRPDRPIAMVAIQDAIDETVGGSRQVIEEQMKREREQFAAQLREQQQFFEATLKAVLSQVGERLRPLEEHVTSLAGQVASTQAAQEGTGVENMIRGQEEQKAPILIGALAQNGVPLIERGRIEGYSPSGFLLNGSQYVTVGEMERDMELSEGRLKNLLDRGSALRDSFLFVQDGEKRIRFVKLGDRRKVREHFAQKSGTTNGKFTAVTR